MSEQFKLLPSVDALLSNIKSDYTHDIVRDRCRLVLKKLRQELAAGSLKIATKDDALHLAVTRVSERLSRDFAPSLRHVINATGIILHTGLGRAPLSPAARENVARVMDGYSSLELDLESGKRGERTDHVRRLLCELTGAEDALLVNNNAAAVFIALNTLAFGKEAIISRGQLVEIGGSFRMPDVMQKSGVIMREVGSTNKTKLKDFERAINENTGAIVVVHTSNYRVLGFTADVDLKELCALGHDHNLPVLHDLGAGVIVDFEKLGLPYEPLVQESIAAGADVITFSGDKVLGGPQSGLLVGNSAWLRKIHQNPIMRAVRCDKLIYAALEETLRLYAKKNFLNEHSVLSMMTESPASIQERANKVVQRLPKGVVEKLNIRIEASEGQFGSGALPLEKLPGYALTLFSANRSTEALAKKLRTGEPPIVGRVQDDKVWLHMRTVRDGDVEGVVKRLDSLD